MNPVMSSLDRRLYLGCLLNQDAAWIERSLATPSVGMRPIHLTLHRLALRRMAAAAPGAPYVETNRETAYGKTSDHQHSWRVF